MKYFKRMTNYDSADKAVTLYGIIELRQQWFRYWLVAWWHQTWTNVDYSSARSCGIHLRAISQQMPKISIVDVSSKITNLRLQQNLPGASDLIQSLSKCYLWKSVDEWRMIMSTPWVWFKFIMTCALFQQITVTLTDNSHSHINPSMAGTF